MLARTVNHPLERIPACFPLGPRWYVFYTHVHNEKRAGEKIQELGYDVLVPFEKRIQRKAGKKPREYESPLFPRYGFVRFDINEMAWGRITEADGVIDVVRSNAVPRCVPDARIDELRLAINMGLLDRTVPPKVGVQVESTEGPLTGFIGKILRARAGDRVDVLFNILGAERVVTTPLSALREA